MENQCQMSMMNDKYRVIYGQDEIWIRAATCLNPGLCTCEVDMSAAPKCGYSPEQIKQIFANYYRKRAEYIEKQSLEDFLYDRGIYG